MSEVRNDPMDRPKGCAALLLLWSSLL